MKCTIPEISWHNRDPVLSVDVQPISNDEFYRLASGGTDSHVLIWHLKILDTGATSVEVVCDLTRHQRAVNVVRWSPTGQYLASGDDDANIIIWHQKADALSEMIDGETVDKEKWSVFKVLRGHKEDIYDISWSPNSQKLLTGSVDNTAIIWDLNKGLNDNILTDHKGFVQGVSWDPQGDYLATLSSDRVCRIFSENGKQVKCRMYKGTLNLPEMHPLNGQIVRYYHDDTLKSFFRRLTFSPDGNLLITPAGCLDNVANNKNLYTTYIYATGSFTQPAAILPSPTQYTIAVRCCPILFELRSDGPEPAICLPYRMIIAVATRSSVVLYDTQQLTPFAVISNIHYTRLTDLTWSHDGLILAVSSTDGFCSLVTFERNELGTEYVKEESDTENIQEEEEKVITPLKEEIEIKKEEKKRPSFLMQWAKKGVDSKPQLKEKDTNIIIINDSPQKNEEINSPNLKDVKKDLNLAQPIAVRRKPKESQNNSNVTPQSQNVQNSKPIETNKKLETTNENSTKVEAKPIEVRKKPRIPESTNQNTTLNSNLLSQDINPIEISEKLKTTNQNTTKIEAKPIEVRKTPRIPVLTNKNTQISSKESEPIEIPKNVESTNQNATKVEAKPIEVRKTPRISESTNKNTQESSKDAEPIEIPKNVKSTNQNAAKIEAKPIEVRKTPRIPESSNKNTQKSSKDAEPIEIHDEVESTNQNTTKIESKEAESIEIHDKVESTNQNATKVEAKPIAIRRKPRDNKLVNQTVSITESTPSTSVDLENKTNSKINEKISDLDDKISKKIQEKDISSPSTSKNSPKTKALKRKSIVDSPKTNKKNDIDSSLTNESPSTKTVRKKSNQMDISKFFTSPSEPPNKKQAIENKSRISLFSKTENITEENAQDSYKSVSEKVDDFILIEDSQDIKLVIEDSQKECSLEAFEKFEKLQCDKEKLDEKIKEIHHNNLETLEKSTVPQVNDIKSKINDLNLLSPIRKKKVPFITLSSPKNKKKQSDTS